MADYDLDPELEKRLMQLSAEIARNEGRDSTTVRQELSNLPKEVLEGISELPQSTFDNNLLQSLPENLKEAVTNPQADFVAYTPSFDHQREERLHPELTPGPSLTPQNKFESDFDDFVKEKFGPAAAKDESLKMNIAASLAYTTASLIQQLDTPSPELKASNPSLADLIAQERSGLNPQLESRLKSILAMSGVTDHSDVLYGAEMPPDIHQQFEQLGQNPHGEQFYASAMKSLGIDQLPPSLVSDENLQNQTPSKEALASVYSKNSPQPEPQAQRLR